MKRLLDTVLTAALLGLALAAPSAQAGVVFATNNFGLYTLNTATGGSTLVGEITSNTSGRNVVDMAAAGNTLYGLIYEQVNNVVQSRLSVINTSTAAASDLPFISGLFTNLGPARRIDTIAYNAGTMYGINNGPNRSLYTIDMMTGAASMVAALAPLGASNGGLYRSLTVGGDGALYASLLIPGDITQASQLVRIDTTTGAQTLVGNTGTAILADLAYDAETGVLFGGGSEVNDTSGTATLYAVDASTGMASLRGGSPHGLWSGLAVLPDSAVPEPGTLLLTAAAGLALLAGRRRRLA